MYMQKSIVYHLRKPISTINYCDKQFSTFFPGVWNELNASQTSHSQQKYVDNCLIFYYIRSIRHGMCKEWYVYVVVGTSYMEQSSRVHQQFIYNTWQKAYSTFYLRSNVHNIETLPRFWYQIETLTECRLFRVSYY